MCNVCLLHRKYLHRELKYFCQPTSVIYVLVHKYLQKPVDWQLCWAFQPEPQRLRQQWGQGWLQEALSFCCAWLLMYSVWSCKNLWFSIGASLIYTTISLVLIKQDWTWDHHLFVPISMGHLETTIIGIIYDSNIFTIYRCV